MARGSGPRQALSARHPRHRFAVPAALVGSTALLLVGLSLPLMHARQMFWKSSYSVWAGVVELWRQGEAALAIIVFFFSMVFPSIKLTALAVIWFARLPDAGRSRLLHWLGALGKWSMLDVFVVAILIVLVKLGPLANVEPRVGVYVFAAAIVSSMLTAMHVERLAKRALRSR